MALPHPWSVVRTILAAACLVELSSAQPASHHEWAPDLIRSDSDVRDDLSLLQVDARKFRGTGGDLDQAETEERELDKLTKMAMRKTRRTARRHRDRRINASLLASRGSNATLHPSNVAWLHVPKCGTSFANVLVSWACPQLATEKMLSKQREHGGIYVQEFVRENKRDCSGGFRIYDGHAPLRNRGRNDYAKNNGNWVTMLRQPEQRLVSGFFAGHHDAETKEQSRADLPTYAKLLAGCAARMLNGFRCGEPVAVTDSMVQTGIERLDSGFAFVGLTEEWDLSVCLFHKKFGGSCASREFFDVRPGMKHAELYDSAELGSWTDPYDGPIYEFAVKKFWEDVEDYGVSLESCQACTDIAWAEDASADVTTDVANTDVESASIEYVSADATNADGFATSWLDG